MGTAVMTSDEMFACLDALRWSVNGDLTRWLGCERRTAARLVMEDPAVGAALQAKVAAVAAAHRATPAPDWRRGRGPAQKRED